MGTGTGNNTACLKSVEDVTVRWGGDFKDCLRIYSSATSQSSQGFTVLINSTYWYAQNLGPIKGLQNSSISHPVEDTGVVINYTLRLISAKVDGIHYGFPAIFGVSQ